MDDKTKEILEKQLELLSERSIQSDSDLPGLTHAMIEVVNVLKNPATCQKYY